MNILMQQWYKIAIGSMIGLATIILLITNAILIMTHMSAVPNFSKIQNKDLQNQVFFAYLLPIAQQANTTSNRARQHIISLQQEFLKTNTINQHDYEWLKYTFKKSILFDPNNDHHWQRLFNSVDIVPISLILAEAAYQSANYSRTLSRKSYNLFGLVCHKVNCGFSLPQNHNNSVFSTVELTIFPSLQKAIDDFLYQLANNPRYQDFRLARAEARKRGEMLNGYQLIGCEKKHRKIKSLYNKHICKLIKRYQLTRYDNV